ncbi:class D sortase [Anaeromicropila herbilytica]|uniref:class D sortase n=1 Tax=Anaeromicropila herbilytica TaxID=2785025 RepID=UPI00232A580E|nr:class D sortase [Anaeromicropila herbilytica]
MIPILTLIVTSGILYIGGKPIHSIVLADIKYTIVKGSPTYHYSEDMVSQSDTSDGNLEQGEVKIPDIGIQYAELISDRFDSAIPIYYGDSEKELQKGVGQYIGSYLPGEGKGILIGGHDTTFFESLDQLQANDKISIRTSYGEYTYQVKKAEIHKADDYNAYDLEADTEQLILYTCYPIGKIITNRQERYYVYCDKIDGPTIVKEPTND